MNDFKKNLDIIYTLIETPLTSGKSIKELTEHENLSYWWFAHFDLIDSLCKLTSSEKPIMPKELSFQKKLSSLPLPALAVMNAGFDITRKLFVQTAFALYCKKKQAHHNANKGKILFTSSDLMWRTVTDFDTGETRTTDIFFDSLIPKLTSRGIELTSTYPCIKYVYRFRKAIQSLGILIDKLKNFPPAHVPFNLYWSFDTAASEYKAAKHFKQRWTDIENDPDLEKLCSSAGSDIAAVIRAKLKFYFIVLFPYVNKRISLATKLLARQKPDLVLLINEYGIFERALLIAAKQLNIPTAAIQHGNIHPAHQGYIYRKTDIALDGRCAAPFCPIPDRTALFGEHFRELLINQSAYPPDSLTVTGQPRYDVICKLKQLPDPKQILRKYNIPTDKKIILWTTQCIGINDQQNIKNFNAVSAAMAQLKDCSLVVKLHPNASEKYAQMTKKYLLEQNNNCFLVPQNADTLRLIAACNCMITQWSTTAVEALAMEKGLIILNLTPEADKIDYVEKGIATGVYQPDQLAPTIKNLLNNPGLFAEKTNRYIEQYLYKIDGNAAERTANMILNMLEM